ncbi:hypothetical protein IEQ34_008892 [Dendrobium chrysotoxum]|uniref:Uncharacterized protein n=1 Tax=Dendrobium chrysotoxum TaxID=161865 RepID=A0AAV7GZ48_DENCH|nr:hypothetical protein IEQ34_008892 [Dendrobium chrysotoxum]
MVVYVKGCIYLASVAVGVYEDVVGYNVGDDVLLGKEEVEEGEDIVEAASALHGRQDGVAGEDGGFDGGEDGVAGLGRGGVEISGADKGLNPVMEAEARTYEGGGGIGKAGGVGVGVASGAGGAGVTVGGGLDSKLALATAALRCGLFKGGEGEVAGRKEEDGRP